MKSKNRLPQDKFSMVGFYPGIASEHLWDREIVCDYFVRKLWELTDFLQDTDAVKNPAAQDAAREIAVMVDALMRAKGRGMDTYLTADLPGIAGFVEWRKEDFFVSIVRQIVRWESSFEPLLADKRTPTETRETMREISNLAGLIFSHDHDEGRVIEEEGTVIPELMRVWRTETATPMVPKKGAA